MPGPGRIDMAWVIGSFFFALVLDSIALGEPFQAYNPPWTLMVLIYWCWLMPRRVGPFAGFCVGLLMDTLSSGILGLNALGGALIGYTAHKLRAVFNRSSLAQRTLMVWGQVLAYKAITGWIQSLFSPGSLGLTYWLSTLVVLVAWPLAYTLLKEVTPVRSRV